MKNTSVLTAILVVSLTTSAQATNIWLSSSPLDTRFGEVPNIEAPVGNNGRKLYIWARPDEGKTLQAWSLNLRSTDSSVARLNRVTIDNPAIDAPPSLVLPGLAVAMISPTGVSTVRRPTR